MQFYFDQSREDNPHALPDGELFYANGRAIDSDNANLDKGWYYWACMPGCLPDSEPEGPFNSMEEALADARGI